MAITQAITNSYKQEVLKGTHLLTDTYKIALFTSAATLDKNTTTYTAQPNEVSNAGTNYTTGGNTLVGFSVTLSGDTAVLDWTTDPQWINATFTARGALIYNDTLVGKNAVMVIDFGSDKAVAAGTFVLVFPAPDNVTGLVRYL